MSRPVVRTPTLRADAMTTGILAPARRIRRSDHPHQNSPGGFLDIGSRGLPHGALHSVGWYDRLQDAQRPEIADHLGRLEDPGHRSAKPEPLRARDHA